MSQSQQSSCSKIFRKILIKHFPLVLVPPHTYLYTYTCNMHTPHAKITRCENRLSGNKRRGSLSHFNILCRRRTQRQCKLIIFHLYFFKYIRFCALFSHCRRFQHHHQIWFLPLHLREKWYI